MHSIKPIALSRDAFRIFGAYETLLDPATPFIGAAPVQFFRDMLDLSFMPGGLASFSVCRVEPRPTVIDVLEYHSACGEALLPLDGDVLVQAGPATAGSEPPLDALQAFHVPRGTLLTLKPGVWHHAPFALGGSAVHILIVLPPRSYANDCVVRELLLPERVAIRI
jgi:ureidoglycolate lyase